MGDGGPDGWDVLSAAERAEFGAIRARPARRARVTTRAALRRVLGDRLGCAAAEVPLGRTPAGKPTLERPASVQFSVSHTDARAAIAVAATPVGIDIERRDPAAFREAAAVFLHAGELAALRHLDHAAGDDLLAALWTGKEAIAKALGTGFLHLDPTRVVFAVPAHGPPWPRHVPGVTPDRRLSLTWLQPDPGHVVAVALLPGSSP